MKILFGGSFDPIHIGHLAIIRGVIEKYHPEKFFLVPARQSMSKIEYVFPPEFRLELIKKSLSDLPDHITCCIEMSLYEINQNRHVYTYETIDFLKPDYLLIGGDHDYTRWKNFHEAIYPSIKKFLVYPRHGIPAKPRGEKEVVLNLKSYDVSSMQIITKLRNRDKINHLVSPTALKAIEGFQLNLTASSKPEMKNLRCE